MRICVTGANGLVGSRLCRLLSERGHEVVGLGRGPRRIDGAHRYLTCELSDGAQVRASLEEAHPEVVVHTASMTEVDACEREPEKAYAANVEAPSHLAKAARALGAHLVHISTDYVFDGANGPYSETDLPNPKGVYALTKHMGEEAVRALSPSSGWTVARTAVVYGWPPSARPNFGSWLVGALRAGQEVRLFEDQWVSPSLASNVAELLAELAERKLEGVWNTCGAEVVNRVQFGEALCEVFGFSRTLLVPSRLAEAKLASPRPVHSGLKVDKARAALTARPLALREALERFHDEWRAG